MVKVNPDQRSYSTPTYRGSKRVGFCPKKKVEVLIHTRLQPGDRDCQEKGNRLNGFQTFSLAHFTWLKPGVNEDRIGPKDSMAFVRMIYFQSPDRGLALLRNNGRKII